MKDHKKPVETFGASAFSNHQTEYYGENGGYDSVLAIPLLLGCCRWVPHPHSQDRFIRASVGFPANSRDAIIFQSTDL